MDASSKAQARLDEARRRRIAARAESAASRIQPPSLVLETPVQRLEDAAEERAAEEFRAELQRWPTQPSSDEKTLVLEPGDPSDEQRHQDRQHPAAPPPLQFEQQQSPSSSEARRKAREQRQLSLAQPPTAVGWVPTDVPHALGETPQQPPAVAPSPRPLDELRAHLAGEQQLRKDIIGMQKAGIPDPLMAAELAQELQAIEDNIAYVQWEINCATQPHLAPQPGPPAVRSYPAPQPEPELQPQPHPGVSGRTPSSSRSNTPSTSPSGSGKGSMFDRMRRRSSDVLSRPNVASGAASELLEQPDSDDEQEIADDRAAVMAHPKRDAVLMQDALHASASVSKVSKGTKLVRRVLVLTDTCLCDVHNTSMKCIHRVQYSEVVAFSLSPNADHGLIIYLDQTLGKASTSDFVMAAPEGEMICAHLQRLFQQRVHGRSLAERAWNPDHGPERTLATLLGGGSVRKNSLMAAAGGSGDDMVGLMSHGKVQRILGGEELVLSAYVSKLGKGKLGVVAKDTLQSRVLAVTRLSVRDIDSSSYQTKHRIPLDQLLSYSLDDSPHGFLFTSLATGVRKEFVFTSEHRDRICATLCASYQAATGKELRCVAWPVAGIRPTLAPVAEADHGGTERAEQSEAEHDASRWIPPVLPIVPFHTSCEQVLAAIASEEVRHQALLDSIDDILDTLKLQCTGKDGWPDWLHHELPFSTGPAVLGDFLDMSDFIINALQIHGLAGTGVPKTTARPVQVAQVYLDDQLQQYLCAYAENCETLGLVAAELRTIQNDHPNVASFLVEETPGRLGELEDGRLQQDFLAAFAAPQLHLHNLIELLKQLCQHTKQTSGTDYEWICSCLDRLLETQDGITGQSAAKALEESIMRAVMTPVRQQHAAAAPWDRYIHEARRVERAQAAVEAVSDGAAREELHDRALALLRKSGQDVSTAVKDAPIPPEMVAREVMDEAVHACKDRFATERLQLETKVAELTVELQAAQMQGKQDKITIEHMIQRLKERTSPPAPPTAPAPAPMVQSASIPSAEQHQAVVIQARELEVQLEAAHAEAADLRADKRRQAALTAGLKKQLRVALGLHEDDENYDAAELVDPAVAQELRSLRVSELRARAVEAGASQSAMDAADDSADTHAAFFSMLVRMHAEKETAEQQSRSADVAALQRALQEQAERFDLATREFTDCVERCKAEAMMAEQAQNHAEARAAIAEGEALRLLGNSGKGLLPLADRNALRLLFENAVESAAYRSSPPKVSPKSSPGTGLPTQQAGITNVAARKGPAEGALSRKQLGSLLLEELHLAESGAQVDEIFSQLWRDAGVGWEAVVGLVEDHCAVEGTAHVTRCIRAAAAQRLSAGPLGNNGL